MPSGVECPSCGNPVSVPDVSVRGQLLCANCGEIFAPPKPGTPRSDPEVRATTIISETFAQLRTAGVASLVLGILSLLFSPIPFLGYVAPAVSAAGLIVGVCDIWSAKRKRQVKVFLLLGIAACLVALFLAVPPLFGLWR